MKILGVGVRETAKTITLFAKCKIRRIGYDEAYFTFDKKYKPFLAADASPFAAALLLPSMKLGDDLIIKGTVSKRLYDGMHHLMGRCAWLGHWSKTYQYKGRQNYSRHPHTKPHRYFFFGWS